MKGQDVGGRLFREAELEGWEYDVVDMKSGEFFVHSNVGGSWQLCEIQSLGMPPGGKPALDLHLL